MKKKIIVGGLLFFIVLFSVSAEYYDDGTAEVRYHDTTTLDEAYNVYVRSFKKYGEYYSEITKLSKAQSRLLWDALGEYDYKVGEIYGVMLRVYGSFDCILVVEIESDDSVAWRGFRCD